jgi:membrane-associated protease RseP (regulator of RpoE activity)
MRARSIALWVLLIGGCGGQVGEVPPRAGGAAAAPAAVSAAAPARGESEGFRAALAAGVRARGGAGGFEVDSFLATVALEELASGSSGLTITAHAGANGVDGYEVRGVAPESLYGRLGLRDGDRVVAINGAPATSPGRVLGALAGAGRHFVVEIEREGVSSFVDLRLVDGLAWTATLAAQGIAAPSVAMEVHSVALSEEALAAAAAAGVGGGASTAASGGEGPHAGAVKASGGGVAKASGGAGSTGGGTGGSAKAGGGAGSTGGTSAACKSASECTIRRSEVSSLISAPEKAMSQARATAVSRGYKLAGVKRGSAVERLGFRDGDVIRSVNGYALNDQAAALALYMSLQSTSVFRVNYERGGAAATKVIRTV